MNTAPPENLVIPATNDCNAVSPHQRLKEFLADRTSARVFTHPLSHPAESTGLCHCEQSFICALPLYVRAALLGLMARCPFNGLKVWLLRRLGSHVGENVHIAPGAWIDPMFPQLLTLEDNVVIGVDAKLLMHEFNMHSFRAGRVIVREGAVVGAFSVIGCGVEIGSRATVAIGAVVRRDVPAGRVAIGNPARVIHRAKPASETFPLPDGRQLGRVE